MASKIGDVIAGSLAPQAKKASPIPTPIPSVVTQAVVDAIGKSEEIAVVPVKPMKKSPTAWVAAGSAVAVLLNQLAPTLGITISQPITDAVETITSFIGLPDGTGRFLVAVGTFAAFGFIWIRQRYFNHSISPTAADRAYDKGKVV
jgi:hypothetical protein